LKDVDLSKVIGLNPQKNGKLQAIKAALILDQNYGIAILEKAEGSTPSNDGSKSAKPGTILEIIPYHKVWHRLEQAKTRNKGCAPRVLRCGQMIRVAQGRYRGLWRIFSVKNNAAGLAVALGEVDAMDYRNDKQNVRVLALLRDGMEILETSLCSVKACKREALAEMMDLPVEKPEGQRSPCPSTSSA
jgi:hypothetical protein